MDPANHTVTMHGNMCILRIDMVGWALLSPLNIIRIKRGGSTLPETDASSDQIRIPWQANPVFLKLDQGALPQVLANFSFESGKVLVGNFHALRKAVDRQGNIFRILEDLQ